MFSKIDLASGYYQIPIRKEDQSTIEQKFDNMITLLDSEHNGGYEFSGYQWYKNGEPIEGENNTYTSFL